jgi:hypothetical protein
MGGDNQAEQILGGMLYPNIFRSFRMALQPSKLIIAFGLIAIFGLTGWIMDFSNTVVTSGKPGTETEFNIYMTSPDRMDSYISKYGSGSERTGVFTTLWNYSRERFHGTLKEIFALNIQGVLFNIAQDLRAFRWAIEYHGIYCLIFGLINLCYVSVACGAICRIAALEFARDERPGIMEAIQYSIKKFTSFFFAPLVPVGIVILIGFFLFIIGLTSNIPLGLGELVVSILTPAALVLGAIIAAVILGTIAGFNLMFPAVAYDGSDGLDAVSRSFNYIFVRPWRMIFYTATAIIYGAICYVFVRFFAYLLLWTAYTGLRFGAFLDSRRGLSDKIAAIWSEPTFSRLAINSTSTTGKTETISAFIVYLSTLIIVGLVVSFIISFYCSANTVIYSLIRNKVDNTPLDEIYTPAQETNLPSNKT